VESHEDKSTRTSCVSSIWSDAQKILQERLSEDAFYRWISIIQALRSDEGTLVLGVDNDFYQTWLEENYLSLINDALAIVTGTELPVRFEVVPDSAKKEQPSVVIKSPLTNASEKIKPSITQKPVSKPSIATTLNPRFTMESFIVGPSNNFAHAASLAVTQAPGRAYNPLFIYGDTGLGKTHLMQAIGHMVHQAKNARVCYISSEQLLNEYIDAVTTRSLTSFRKKYRTTDVLLVDDIHFLAGKERIQEEFFHTFNALYDAHKQIVMTSDRPAKEIRGLEERLVSRFEWGLVTELEPPDLETRIAILRRKQQQHKCRIDDNSILFIAEHVRSNIRRLEGALVRTVSFASLMNKQLEKTDLEKLLKEFIEVEERIEITCSSIQKVVAEHFDIRLSDMTSSRRPRSIAVPRQIAMYLCREMTHFSLPDIANSFAKTHATVLHAHRTINDRMDVDRQFKSEVEELARKMGASLHA
jgi:chromosomal replication initiator protein